MNTVLTYLYTLTSLLFLTNAYSRELPVRNPAEFTEAVGKLQPGDTLVMHNGVWRDALLVFKGTGTATKPIVLRAEKAGGVSIEGKSRLRLAGQYLVVTGLYFRNGQTPGGGVIEFREDGKNLAFNSRVTECVIDGFNNPDRMKEDIWVQLYGQHNRFDHNYVAGKKNGGVTMAVQLNDEQNQNNEHRIDHNYFGPRPRLGSNGGETIRVGVSTYSLTSSKTLIEENYFYHCNGEVEIVSIKSCDNIIRRNMFVECEGGVVMRHGNRNLIEGNVFLGNGKPHTGGVRIINAGHRIYNNYFDGLAGEGFRSALTIMNGVPNSPLNRYNQVRDVVIAYNTFIDCKSVELAAGKDLERTARPENVRVSGNVFYSPKTDSLFHVFDDISGITFTDNVLKTSLKPFLPGMVTTPVTLTKTLDGLTVPVPKDALPTGFSVDGIAVDIAGTSRKAGNLAGAVLPASVAKMRRPVVEADAGPRWFHPTDDKSPKTGNVWPVRAGEPDALFRVCQQAKPNDVIELVDPGQYPVSKVMMVTVPITVRAKAGLATRPVLAFAGDDGDFAFFSIENGGALQLDGLTFNGTSEAGVAGCMIRTSSKPMIEHYNLFVNNCVFQDLTEGGRQAFRATKSTYADTVQFTNCVFSNITGDVLSLASEKEDKGVYNAEYVILKNCLFRNILMGALDLYRGGNDESTLGPFLTVDHCTFDNVGNVELGHVLRVLGVQWTDIRNSIFNNSGRAGRSIHYENYGWTTNLLTNTNFYQSGRIESFYPVQQTNVTTLPVAFTGTDYRLKPASPLAGMATNGQSLGFVAVQ